MKITLDALDGRNFTLRLALDDGRGEQVIALHDTKRLRGLYAHDAARFSLDPVEADAIVGEVTWTLADGSLHLAGPVTLGATRLDLDIRRDDRTPGITGEARCASLDAPVTRLDRAGMKLYGALQLTALDARHDDAADAWVVTVESFEARATSLAQDALRARFEGLDARTVEARIGGSTAVSVAELVVRDLSLTVGDTEVKAAGATLTGLRVVRDAAGVTVEAGAATLTGVEVTSGKRRVRSPELRLGTLRYGAEGVSFARLAADELALAIEGLGGEEAEPAHDAEPAEPAEEPPPGTRKVLGLDLPLLDGLDAKVEADIVVDLKLPVIERRQATHRLRLAVDRGVIDFKQLEGGLSTLENAILDFEVVDAGLMLELDAVVVKRELLLWPLADEGMRLARQNKVRLRTLACPTMVVHEPSSKDDEAAPSPVALRRLEVKDIRVEGALRSASLLPVGDGTLRLGVGDTPALGRLRVTGAVAYDPDGSPPDTVLSVELADLDVGLDAVAVGARRLDVSRARLGQLADAKVTLRGVRPRAVTATLRAVELEGFRLRNG